MKIEIEKHPLRRKNDSFDLYEDLHYTNFGVVYTAIDALETKNYVSEMMEIQSLKVSIRINPSEEGLNKFHDVIPTIQSNKDRFVEIINQAYIDLAVWEDASYHVNRFYTFNRNELMEDPIVKELRNKELQLASIEKQISDIVDAKLYCERQITKIKTFLKQCEHVYNNLKSTNDNISRQITVIERQMDIGEIKRKY